MILCRPYKFAESSVRFNSNNNNNNTFIDKENQYDTNVSVIKIKSSLWYQIIFIIKNA